MKTTKINKLDLANMVLRAIDYYTPKQEPVAALQYNGGEDMAIAISEMCEGCHIEYDEAGMFCGLCAFTEDDLKAGAPTYVYEGDYLVRFGYDEFVLIGMDEFEERYEIFPK
jgi:hypothetical protein